MPCPELRKKNHQKINPIPPPFGLDREDSSSVMEAAEIMAHEISNAAMNWRRNLLSCNY
jgi:hypothetical protein